MKRKLLLLTTLLSSLLFQNILFSQNPTAPVVGSVRNFILYTSAGSITNSGTNSVYSGNVGTNGGGTLVGFGTLVTQPTNLFTYTAETIKCNSDLATLYEDLNIRVADTETPGGYLTQTLSPGIYHSTGAVSIGGILTLDGGGNPDARFIIKTDGAFTMAADSKIVLTNGTEAKNVFWLARGAMGVAAGAEAKGIFVSLAGAISMGAGCTLQGSMLTLDGSITTLDNMNLSKAITIVNTMVLVANQTVAEGATPAELVLTGNMSAVIKWQSATNATFSSPTDIDNTTTALFPGILTASTFFRAVIFIEDTFVYSNYVKITLPVRLPDMTGISSFVLFTSAGALTNTGDRTTFSGNVGNGAGPISGFPNPADPLLHGETDPLTIKCKANLSLLYNAINEIANTDNGHAVGFGNGEVLLPGVYSLSAAITVGGELTFDAQNDPNAVFIIKTAGAFATPANTKMKLINGAVASNIFWNIESGLEAGANTDLIGTFICHIGAIITGDNCSLEGRLLTMSGAVTVANAKLAVSTPMRVASSQTIAAGMAPINLIVTGNSSPIIKWQSSLTTTFKFPVDINTSETTLVIAPLTISTYFRAVIELDGAQIYSKPIKITVTNPSIAPDMGPASSFTLFTSIGAVNNTGTSTYIGNIGTNLGAITGFVAPNNTNLHIKDNLTAVCADYLPEIFKTIKEIPATNSHLGPMGAGETVSPGVYEINSAVTLSGELILDGEFQDNPVFIIKIKGSLTTAATTKMTLINGASPSNVFWITDSDINIGAGSDIKGTFISLYGNINIGDASIFDGQFLTINGVVSMSNCSLALATTYPLPLLKLSESQTIPYETRPLDLVVTGNNTPITKWQSSLNTTFTNPVDINQITTTLTFACSNPITTTTYFRAVITTAGVNEYSNYIKITVLVPTNIPDMGAAGIFVLFTTGGAVTNHGTATFSGYVGTNYGAISGYPNLSDPLLRTQDGLTQSCAAALPGLFNLLKAIPTTAGHAAGFGGGEVLYPGVIQVLEATTVGGDLILDGRGNENAVFVFKVTGAVWLAAGTRIVLRNGTKAANVYWAIDGALGAGAACEVRGNYICLAGAIAFGETCLIDGRIYTMAGAIVLGNSQFTFPIPNLIVASPDQNIDYGSQPANLILTSSSEAVLRWEKSTDNFATAGIPINNTTFLLTGAEIGTLFETTYFRAVVTGDFYSKAVTLKINPVTIPGTISSDQSICNASIPADLVLTGNNGSISKWQKSLTSSFSNPIDINNSTAILSGNEIGPLNATTYFRAVVQNCIAPIANTDVVVISITEAPIVGTISSNQVFCSPTRPNSLTLSGNNVLVTKWQSASDSKFTSPTDIINTTTILSDIAMGVVTSTTYYRAVVQDCNSTMIYSLPASISIAGTTTWTGNSWSNGDPSYSNSAIFASNFTTTGNIESCNLTLHAGVSVTVSSGYNITLGGALIVDPSSSFTLENNANLLQTSTVANSGKITVKRESALLYRSDYSLWSSPVAGQNVRNFSPATLINRFYFYNSAAPTNGDYAALFNNADFPNPNPETYNFELAQGYYIRSPNTFANYVPAVLPAIAVPGVKFLAEFTGTPNNGTITSALNTVNNGFNLTGNPYPSELNLVPFFTDNQGSIDGTIWLFRKINNLGTTNTYATMTTLGITSVQPEVTAMYTSSILNTGQGFFVKTKLGLTPANLIFNNAMRTGTNLHPFFKSTNKAPEKSRIWLNLSDSKEIKAQILVGYLDGATNGFDYGIEGKNFADTPTNLSSVVENVDYAIQGRPLPFNTSDVVALNFKTAIEGSYSISIDHADGLFLTSQAVFLRDNLTGNVHNLKDTVYTFTSKIGTFSSRFELVYQKTLGTNDLTFNENSVVVYKQKNGNLLINSGNFIMDTIELYDISGRLIFSKKEINSNNNTIASLSIANQILIVKIKTAENGMVIKKVMY